jgi:hypothetical protein
LAPLRGGHRRLIGWACRLAARLRESPPGKNQHSEDYCRTHPNLGPHVRPPPWGYCEGNIELCGFVPLIRLPRAAATRATAAAGTTTLTAGDAHPAALAAALTGRSQTGSGLVNLLTGPNSVLLAGLSFGLIHGLLGVAKLRARLLELLFCLLGLRAVFAVLFFLCLYSGAILFLLPIEGVNSVPQLVLSHKLILSLELVTILDAILRVVGVLNSVARAVPVLSGAGERGCRREESRDRDCEKRCDR